MKTTRTLIPVLTLAAAASLMAQAQPGATPKPQPAPPPTEAFPAPGDPAPKLPAAQPKPAAPAPAVQPKPPAPAVLPKVPGPAVVPAAPQPQPPVVIVPPTVQPKAPAAQPQPAVNPLNEPRAEPFIGIGKINGTRVSARGRATIFSALVFQFNKNEPVKIIETIDIKNPKAGEPRKWLRVQMPQDTGVWVHNKFLGKPFTKNMPNAAGQPVPLTYAEVTANLLNVRGGAGENHPIVGKLRKGTIVRLSTQKKGTWVELFAPANASVYVAAQFVTPIPLNGGVVEVPGAPVQPQPVQPGGQPVQPVQPIPPVAGGTQPVQPVQPGGQPVQPKPGESVVTIPKNQFGQPEGLAPDGTPIKRAGTPGTTKPGSTTPKPPAKPAEPVETVKPVEPKPPVKPVEPVETVKPVEPKPTIQAAKPTENGNAGKTTEPDETVKPEPTETAAKPEAKPETKPETKPEEPIRIVTREGVVRRKYGLNDPTTYALVHTESGKTINYLLLDRPDIRLKWFTGQKVLVSGQEAIDPRAATIPVLKVKTLKGDVSPKVIQEFIVARAKARQKAREEAAAKIEEATTPQEPKEQPKPTEPTEPKPETEKPAEPKPAEPKLAEPKPEGEKQNEPKPEVKPEGEKPAEPKPEEKQPEKTPKPVQENQVENK